MENKEEKKYVQTITNPDNTFIKTVTLYESGNFSIVNTYKEEGTTLTLNYDAATRMASFGHNNDDMLRTIKRDHFLMEVLDYAKTFAYWLVYGGDPWTRDERAAGRLRKVDELHTPTWEGQEEVKTTVAEFKKAYTA